MQGKKLNKFASPGISGREGRRPALADKAMLQAGKAEDVHLPIVSSSTGAAVTTVIRSH